MDDSVPVPSERANLIVRQFHRYEAYFARQPDYPRGITVPAIVEVESGKVVTNDFPQITHDISFEWREHQRPDAPDLWPADLREEMEAVMKRVFPRDSTAMRSR